MKRLLLSIIVMLSFTSTTVSAQAGKQKAAIVMNHLALHVTNLQTSTAFYTGIIGLDTIPEPFHDGKHIWLSMGGNTQLHLIAEGTTSLLGKQNHICFSVTSVDEFITRLQQSNIPFEDLKGATGAITTRPDGVKQIYFQDPDGRWVEVNDAK